MLGHPVKVNVLDVLTNVQSRLHYCIYAILNIGLKLCKCRALMYHYNIILHGT